MYIAARCYRCERILGGRRRLLRHLAHPCAADTPVARRARAAVARADAAPRPSARGRKLMMRAPTDDDAPA